jgi:hypothetical protein
MAQRRSRLILIVLLAVILAVLVAMCFKRRGASTPAATITADVSDPAPGAAQGGNPTPVKPITLEWLVANSPFIFVGHLSNTRVETDGRGLVITRNIFDVENALAGAASQKTVTLTTLGGTVGDETFSVSHTPEFVSGQTYLIFTDLARTTYDAVTGDDAGVFLVVDSGVYTSGGRAVVGVQDGRIRLGAMVLEQMPSVGTRLPAAGEMNNPTVGGGVIKAERAIVETARPLSLAEFTRYVLATRR